MAACPLPLVGRGGERRRRGGATVQQVLRMPHSAITKRTRRQARALRRSPTDAERKLWFLLRSLKPLGIHFRRQAPIGIYIADFAWHAGKIGVELDGSTACAGATARMMATRTHGLQSQGYRVLRFWNIDVLKIAAQRRRGDPGAAHEMRRDAENPTPNPSPQGGGERAARKRPGSCAHDRNVKSPTPSSWMARRSTSATARRSSAPAAASTSTCRTSATCPSPATGRTATAASAWSRSRANACWRQAACARRPPA